MSDLRAAVEALQTPERYKDDANGNWFTTDMEYGWECAAQAILALIDAHQCYDEAALAEALTYYYIAACVPSDRATQDAAAIIARLRA